MRQYGQRQLQVKHWDWNERTSHFCMERTSSPLAPDNRKSLLSQPSVGGGTSAVMPLTTRPSSLSIHNDGAESKPEDRDLSRVRPLVQYRW